MVLKSLLRGEKFGGVFGNVYRGLQLDGSGEVAKMLRKSPNSLRPSRRVRQQGLSGVCRCGRGRGLGRLRKGEFRCGRDRWWGGWVVGRAWRNRRRKSYRRDRRHIRIVCGELNRTVCSGQAFFSPSWCRGRVRGERILPSRETIGGGEFVGYYISRDKYFLGGWSIAPVCFSFPVEAKKDTSFGAWVQLGPRGFSSRDVYRRPKNFKVRDRGLLTREELFRCLVRVLLGRTKIK